MIPSLRILLPPTRPERLPQWCTRSKSPICLRANEAEWAPILPVCRRSLIFRFFPSISGPTEALLAAIYFSPGFLQTGRIIRSRRSCNYGASAVTPERVGPALFHRGYKTGDWQSASVQKESRRKGGGCKKKTKRWEENFWRRTAGSPLPADNPSSQVKPPDDGSVRCQQV